MRWPSLSYAVLPLVIIIVSIIVALIGYSLMTVNLGNPRAKYTSLRMRENELRIGSVFDSYAHLLWGSTGRLQSAEVDEGSWREFIWAFDLRENFSGIEALGLTTGTDPSDQKIAFASPRTDDTNAVLGRNLAELPVIATSLNEAALNGDTMISGPIPDIFSTKTQITDREAGFLMVAPYYDKSLPQNTPDERLQSLRGYTVAVFRGDIFFDKAYKTVDLSHTKVDIYLENVSPDNKLHTVGTNTETITQTATQEIEFYGKNLIFVFTFDKSYMLSWTLTYMPHTILISVLVLGMLFAGVAGYLLRSRYQRLTFEKERDVNFAKDELLSLASHQLRTPATGVKQYLGMVLQGFAGEVPDKQRSYLERAYASNNRQLHVINDILHLAKLETGRIVLAERKFDIAKMLREVVDEQRDQAEKGEITVRLQAPSQGWIMGDSHMLWMVMENLVSNAIKYTPPKGVVTVRLVRRGNRWVLTVKDTGVGIDKKDFSKLFKQFSRISNARSDFVTGTGVGLYLAHHLTVLHGGSISVSSTKDRGSTFTVRLPRKL
jgi:signal transduction histidine kinase